MRLSKGWALLVLPLLVSACSPGSIGVGIFGGSDSGLGVGMSFPWPGNSNGQAKVANNPYGFMSGQIIAQNKIYYRRYIGIASNNSMVVQDFYQPKNGNQESSQERKASDIFILTSQGSVLGGLPLTPLEFDQQEWSETLAAWLLDLKADGLVTLWHENGHKALSLFYAQELPQGSYIQWYDNGQVHWQGEYSLGKRKGVWKQWSQSGQLLREYNFSQ